MQRHLPGGVRRTAQARVEGADAGLDAVEHGLGDLGAVDVVLGDLRDGPVHRQVVLAGGDDEVDLLQQAVLVHLVVVEQRAARRLADADALQPVDAGVGAQVGRDAGPGRPAAARSARSRPGSRSAGRSGRRTTTLTVRPPRWRYSISSASASGVPMCVADVEPGQRADAVDAVRVAERPVVRRFQVRVRLDRLADELARSAAASSPSATIVAVAVAEAEPAVVVLPACRPGRPGP